MEKKTYEEILSILEENIPARILITGEDDDYDGNDYEYPESVENDEKVLANQAEFDKIDTEMENHAGYRNYEKRDERFTELSNRWNELRDINVKLNVHLKQLGIGKMVEVQQKGGSDQGSEWYSVRHFVDHDIYIKFNYYYSSYEGIAFEEDEYGSCQNVEPVEKMIIVYDKKK